MSASDARDRHDVSSRSSPDLPDAGPADDGAAPVPCAACQFPDRVWQHAEQWLRRCVQVITDSAPALDALNVFPVADADTGANLGLTFRGIDRSVPRVTAQTLGELTTAAIQSAHGNSGAIVAEMIGAAARVQPSDDAASRQLVNLLTVVATGATQAVARPVDGTILTVARATADGARQVTGSDPLAVAEAARSAAAAALNGTVNQLPALRQAGVVDAGGQAYLLLLDVLVEVLGGRPAQPLTRTAEPPALRPDPGPAPAPDTADGGGPPHTADEYEVMYTVRGADRDALTGLRGRLDAIGDSVVVVGDHTVAQIHVHLADAGAAIQPALGLGDLSQIKITTLRPRGSTPRRRIVISMVAGRGLADTTESQGGTAVPVAGGPVGASTLADLLAADTDEVIILPNDMEQLEMAHLLAREATGDGRRVAVIPTVVQVQGLAALAVHEPTGDFDDVVSAMTEAAFGTRHGAITIAEAPVATMAGRCVAGDVLGIVGGDIIHVGDSLTEIGWRVMVDLIENTPASGRPSPTADAAARGRADLLTVIIGDAEDVDLAHDLSERARCRCPGIEIQVLFGGQARYPMLIGVE